MAITLNPPVDRLVRKAYRRIPAKLEPVEIRLVGTFDVNSLRQTIQVVLRDTDRTWTSKLIYEDGAFDELETMQIARVLTEIVAKRAGVTVETL